MLAQLAIAARLALQSAFEQYTTMSSFSSRPGKLPCVPWVSSGSSRNVLGAKPEVARGHDQLERRTARELRAELVAGQLGDRCWRATHVGHAHDLSPFARGDGRAGISCARGARALGQSMATAVPDRTAQMFPELTPARSSASPPWDAGATSPRARSLFDVGDQNTPLLRRALRARIEVVQPVGGVEDRIVVHGPGQFTGEINMLSARRSLVAGANHERERAPRRRQRRPAHARAARRGAQRDPHARLHPAARAALDVAAQDLVLVGSRHSARHAAHQGVPEPQRAALPLPGRRDRARGPGAARWVPGRRQRDPDRHLPGRARSQEPVDRRRSREMRASTRSRPTVVRDVVIVGAGPAGLAAAVYGASEGPRRSGPRGDRARRPSRHELAHRELPRLSRRASRGRPLPGARSRRPRSSAPRSPSAARPFASTATAGRTASTCRTDRRSAHALDRDRHAA